MDGLKDLVITRGENVYPREIEELPYTRPEVQECEVLAVIVPKPDAIIDPAARMKAFFWKHLAPFKVPKALREKC